MQLVTRSWNGLTGKSNVIPSIHLQLLPRCHWWPGSRDRPPRHWRLSIGRIKQSRGIEKKNSVCLFVWRSVYLQIGRDERRWSDWWCGSRDVTRRPLSNFDWLHPMSFISGRTTFSQTSQINLDVVDVTGVIFPRRTNKYDPIRFTIRLWIGKIPHCSLYVELIRFHWQLKVIVKHSEQSSEFASW